MMRAGWVMDLTGAGVLPLPVFVSRPSISAYEQIGLRLMAVGRAGTVDRIGRRLDRAGGVARLEGDHLL